MSALFVFIFMAVAFFAIAPIKCFILTYFDNIEHERNIKASRKVLEDYDKAKENME